MLAVSIGDIAGEADGEPPVGLDVTGRLRLEQRDGVAEMLKPVLA